MALIHGKRANVLWVTPAVLELGQSWSVDVVHDMAEITSFQDTWKTFLSGFQDWTATVECLEDSAGPDVPIGGTDGLGDDARLELYVVYEGSNYQALYGNAYSTGISKGQDKDGIPTVTYTFQGNGQLLWYSNTVIIA